MKKPKARFLSSLYGFSIRLSTALLVLCALYVGFVRGVLQNPVHITISQGK